MRPLLRPAARAAVLALALSLGSPAAVVAAEPHALRGDLRTDLVLTGATMVFWVGTELGKGSLAAAQCRFCAPNALDSAARDALVVRWHEEAATASDLLAFGALPLGAAAWQVTAARGAGAGWGEAGKDVLYVAEAAAVAASLNQAVKLAVGRQRPFVREAGLATPGRPAEADDNLSFYSGHTSLAFSLAAAAGTVSDLRGYRGTPWVWGVGLTLAATTGYARIAADKHWLTDVLVGAAAGTAIGVALPRWLHGRVPEGERADGDGTTGGTTLAVTAFPLGVVGTF